MSYTVSIKAQFKDEAIIRSTCKEMGLSEPIRGNAKLFTETVNDSLAVKLPGWNYPVAIDTKTGEAKFDNYNGKWGAQEHLDRFKQLYTVNKSTAEARKLGYIVTRQPAKNGGINLLVTGFKS